MLKKTNKRLVGPDSQKIFCIGYTYVSLTWGKNNSKQLVYVCKNVKKALLGKPAIHALHILNVDFPEEVRCEAIEESYTNKFIKEFPKVFNGLGKMKGEPVHIQLKPDTVPFHLSAARHVALPMQDKVRIELSRVINEGWPDERKQCDDRNKMYWDYCTDLSLFDGLILKGCQTVIPATLRREILDRIHTGHQGIVKCKRRARSSCFWPNMNKQIEHMVVSCGECQRLQASKETLPLLPHEVPEKPWQKVRVQTSFSWEQRIIS